MAEAALATDMVVAFDEKNIAQAHVAPIVDPEARPACFKSTVVEILFVLTATMAIAMGSFLGGSVTVITSFVGKDLGMTTAEITWISSASSYVSNHVPDMLHMATDIIQDLQVAHFSSSLAKLQTYSAANRSWSGPSSSLPLSPSPLAFPEPRSLWTYSMGSWDS